MSKHAAETPRENPATRAAGERLLERAVRDQEPSPRAGVPGPAAAAVGGLFRAASALRAARSLHPDGVVFEATLHVDRPARELRGVPLLSRTGRHASVVRLSRAVGLPQPLPDMHGLAVRIVDAHGEGRHQDFPLVTSLDGALLHHLLLPSRGFFSLPYSSVLLYRLGDQVRLVGALPRSRPLGGGTDFDQLLHAAAGTEIRFDLAVAAPFGRWRPVAELTLGDPVHGPDVDRLRFNPWNTGGGIRPLGPLMGLREAAYRDSQRGWEADARDGGEATDAERRGP